MDSNLQYYQLNQIRCRLQWDNGSIAHGQVSAVYFWAVVWTSYKLFPHFEK